MLKTLNAQNRPPVVVSISGIHLFLGFSVALIFTASALRAQGRALTQYPVEVWQRQAGLPGNAVQSLVQTRDGYLWIGTEDGLARFDGVRFVEFSKRNTPALAINHVTVVARDAAAGLWVGTSGGGLAHYDAKGFKSLTAVNGLSSDAIYALHQDRSGTLWVGTAKGVDRISSGSLRAVPFAKLSGMFVRALAPELSGGIWAGTEKRGLFILRNDTLAQPAGAGPLKDESIRVLLSDGADGVWVGTARGLFHLANGRLESMENKSPILARAEIRALMIDREGALWIGTAGSGLIRIRNDRVENLTSKSGLPNDVVTSLIEDREGNLWAGTQGAGLAVLRKGIFLGLTPREGLSGEIALPIMEDLSGSLWIGTFGGGLNRYRNGRVTSFTSRDGLVNDFVLSLGEDSDSTLWIGTRGGLNLRRKGVISRYHPDTGEITSAVIAIIPAANGGVWVGTSAGLWRIQNGKATLYTTEQGLSSNFIYALLLGRNGDLWIGTNGGGLNRFSNGTFTSYGRTHGLKSDVIVSLHEDAEGALWIATAAALTRLKNGKFASIDSRNGLPEDRTYRILQDSAGNFWMSSTRGVFRVEKKELEAVIEGRARSLRPVVFTEKDGLPSAEANGGIQPAGWKDRSGRLWFPTMKGVASVDPSLVSIERAVFPVRVEEVLVNDSLIPPGAGPIHLDPDARRIEFAYTAITFLGSESILFQYRMDGYDKTWVDAGKLRNAFYTNLRPGSYAFHVRARHLNGDWSDLQGRSTIVIHPWFYQTLWFRLAVAFAAIAGIVGLDRLRVSTHKRRERELMALAEERKRAESRYRDLFEGANDIVFTADLEGRITSANRRAMQALGISDHSVESTSLSRIVTAESISAFNAATRTLNDSDGQRIHEIDLVKADGTRMAAEASIQAIHDGKATIGVQAIVRDVTERKSLEEQLRQAHRLESVGQLAGGIAHDFNNLLTVIKSTAHLLREEMSPTDRSVSDIAEIELAADRAATLTHQLLAFSRRQVLTLEVVDLNVIVQEVSRMLARTIRENIDVRTKLESKLFHVEVDPGQMHQVLMNLGVNSRDAMPDGGVLTIRTFNTLIRDGDSRETLPKEVEAGSYATLEVEDTGTGMTAEGQKRAFDPFYSTKEIHKGSGLGLATVYGIVKQSGGHIWLRSAVGRGTVFTVLLPAVEKAITVKTTRTRKPHSPKADETILVVEDDPAVRTLMERILSRQGYTVLTAEDGASALRMVEKVEGRVDLVLTDVIMPVMGGMALTRQLHGKYPRIKVLLTSGYAADEIGNIGVQPGVGFLRKPSSPEDIRQKVRELLESVAGTGASSV